MKAQKIAIPLFLLCMVFFVSGSGLAAGVTAEVKTEEDYIKWMSFDVPYSALKKAMYIDIKSHDTDKPINWIELLAYLAANYWGKWEKYRSADMDAVVEKLNSGETIASLTGGSEYYGYYYEAYHAVLSGFIGSYKIETSSQNSDAELSQPKYGLKAFSPIAKGFWYTHYDDYGNTRSYGYSRKHLGNDLLGSVGTPIVAVESGIVEALGWNKYGGWRIGIRSFDRLRYYYYAHLRKNWPYVTILKEGQTVRAGDVIGYVGRTGYSTTENTNNIKVSHLHFGMQIIFDESQKEGTQEIWIDVYDIVKLLSLNKSEVKKDESTREYYSVYDFIDLQHKAYFQ